MASSVIRKPASLRVMSAEAWARFTHEEGEEGMARGVVLDWTLGDRLRKAREHAGLAQKDMVKAFGVDGKDDLELGTRPRLPPNRPARAV